MDCSKCNKIITDLNKVYRYINHIVICLDCAPLLINCCCGSIISINSIHKHKLSKKHNKILK